MPRDKAASVKRKPGTRGAKIGYRILAARKAKNMSQAELAEAFSKKTGKRRVSVQAVSQWENEGREDFYQWELEGLAAVLGVPCGFFTSEAENSSQSVESLIQSIDTTQGQGLALVAYSDIVGGTDMLNQAIDESLRRGRVYKTAFPLPPGGFTYPCPDNSNAPTLIKATVVNGVCISGSMLSIAPNAEFEPAEDFLLVRIGKEVFLRRYEYDGDQVLLVPVNPAWKTIRISREEWEETVEIIGVLASEETRRRPIATRHQAEH